MSMLDRLRSQLGKTNQIAATDETRRVEQLQTGLTGRESAPSSGPRSSTLAERISQGQVRAAESEQARKERVQSEQLKLAEDAQLQSLNDQQLAQVESALDMKQQVAQRTEQLLNDLERSTDQLDFQKDAAKFEQVGFNLRMNNRKYIDSLNDAARRARLDDDARFREELLRATLDESRELLDSDLEFRRLMSADEREFTRELSNLSIEQALQYANAGIEQANRLGKYQSIGTLISGAAQGYQQYETQQTNKRQADYLAWKQRKEGYPGVGGDE